MQSQLLETTVNHLALYQVPTSWESLAHAGSINALKNPVCQGEWSPWDWWCFAARLTGTSVELRQMTLRCMDTPRVSMRAIGDERGEIDIYIGGKHLRYSEVFKWRGQGDKTTRRRLMTSLIKYIEKDVGFELRPCRGIKFESQIYIPMAVFDSIMRAEVDYRKGNSKYKDRCYATVRRLVLEAADVISTKSEHIAVTHWVKSDGSKGFEWHGKTHKTSLEFVRESSDTTEADGPAWRRAARHIRSTLVDWTVEWDGVTVPMEYRTSEELFLTERLASDPGCVLLGLVPVVMGVCMDETNANFDEMLEALNKECIRRGFYLNWWTNYKYI